jgi:hypothetical protein
LDADVSADQGRPAVITLYNEADDVAGDVGRRCVLIRRAWKNIFGHFAIGHNIFDGSSNTASHACHGRRSSHDPHEVSTRLPVHFPGLEVTRKFILGLRIGGARWIDF